MLRTIMRPLGAFTVALALALAWAPMPASATGVTIDVFVGTATLTGGVNAPCLPLLRDPTQLPPWTKGTKTCPPGVNICTGGIPNCLSKNGGKLVDVNGNTRTGTMTWTTCVSQSTTVNKPGQGPGNCGATANFVYTGYCGLSQIQGVGTETSSNLLGGFVTRSFTFTGSETGGAYVVRGNWTDSGGNRGDFISTLSWVPTVAVENSCLDKTARFFTVVGMAAFMNPKVLP